MYRHVRGATSTKSRRTHSATRRARGASQGRAESCGRLALGSRRGLAGLIGVLIGLLCPTTLAAEPMAQPTAAPPLTGRPAQFSDIVGSYTIAVTAAPTKVPVEEPITLRITIHGTGPSQYQPRHKL